MAAAGRKEAYSISEVSGMIARNLAKAPDGIEILRQKTLAGSGGCAVHPVGKWLAGIDNISKCSMGQNK